MNIKIADPYKTGLQYFLVDGVCVFESFNPLALDEVSCSYNEFTVVNLNNDTVACLIFGAFCNATEIYTVNAIGLEEVIGYIKNNCLKDGGKPAGENFSDVNFEEL